MSYSVNEMSYHVSGEIHTGNIFNDFLKAIELAKKLKEIGDHDIWICAYDGACFLDDILNDDEIHMADGINLTDLDDDE